jgi:uncharacterized OB-fold protein
MTAPTTVARPLPLIDPETAFFWAATKQHRLEFLYCADCDRYVHHPQPLCPGCLGSTLAPRAVSGRGTVYTFTVAEQAFHPFWADRLPYVLGVIELAEKPGLRFLSQLVDVDPDTDLVGLPVEVVWEDVDDEVTLPFFRPVTLNKVSK